MITLRDWFLELGWTGAKPRGARSRAPTLAGTTCRTLLAGSTARDSHGWRGFCVESQGRAVGMQVAYLRRSHLDSRNPQRGKRK